MAETGIQKSCDLVWTFFRTKFRTKHKFGKRAYGGGEISSIFSQLIADAVRNDDIADNADFEYVSKEFLDGIADSVIATKKRLDGFKKVNENEAGEIMMDPNGDECCFVQTIAFSDLTKSSKCDFFRCTL